MSPSFQCALLFVPCLPAKAIDIVRAPAGHVHDAAGPAGRQQDVGRLDVDRGVGAQPARPQARLRPGAPQGFRRGLGRQGQRFEHARALRLQAAGRQLLGLAALLALRDAARAEYIVDVRQGLPGHQPQAQRVQHPVRQRPFLECPGCDGRGAVVGGHRRARVRRVPAGRRLVGVLLRLDARAIDALQST